MAAGVSAVMLWPDSPAIAFPQHRRFEDISNSTEEARIVGMVVDVGIIDASTE